MLSNMQSDIDSWSGNAIDNKANIAQQNVYLFVGSKDAVVGPRPMQAVQAQYIDNGAEMVSMVQLSNTAHVFPTNFNATGDNPCSATLPPYISNCNYDGAKAVLTQFYGTLQARNNAPAAANYIEFNQSEFTNNIGMAATGWVYVPVACSVFAKCKLHVAFHGCAQSTANIGDKFVKNTGYTRWADTNNIIVLDPKTYKVVKDLKTSRRPRDMHFNDDKSLLYVACGDDDVIDVIDVAKLEVVRKIATGASPESFALDEKRRRIYVSNEEGSSLSIIDIDKGITIHEVPTGAEPEGVMIHEEGKTLYVTSEVGDLVHLVDIETGAVVKDVVVGTRPRRFAATPDNKELWVTAELSGEVWIIDRDRFEAKGKIEFLPPGMRKSDVTPVGLVMTKDGKTAYVTQIGRAHV